MAALATLRNSICAAAGEAELADDAILRISSMAGQ